MPAPTAAMHAATRRLAGLLILLAGGLAQGVPAGERPLLGLAQADADGQPALPRISAGEKPQPLISFELALDPGCPGGTLKPELILSIANTTQVIAVTRPRQTLAVPVPLGQLPWLASPAESCAALDGKRNADATGEAGQRLFRLHAVTAVFATLLCPAGDSRTLSTSSALPLDAWLACPAPGTPSP